MKIDLPDTLAARIQFLRDKYYLSKDELASLSNIDISTISNLEDGTEIFISSAQRQRLAKVLKVPAYVLKEVEKQPENKTVPKSWIDSLKDNILDGNLENNYCPSCNSLLKCYITTFIDLEDNPVEHPKATCTKCPFQMK